MLDQLTNQNNEEEVHPSAEIVHVLLYLKSRWVFQLVSWKRSLNLILYLSLKIVQMPLNRFMLQVDENCKHAAQLHKEELRIYFTLFSKVSRK